jgi:hypothetical protein
MQDRDLQVGDEMAVAGRVTNKLVVTTIDTTPLEAVPAIQTARQLTSHSDL